MLTIPERAGLETDMLQKMQGKAAFDLRVCGPGIIKSFDPSTLTCTVQMAIREKLNFSGNLEWAEIPVLQDVPVVITGTADYFITFPIVEGTECLVVFGDNCMDAWWQSGGVQNQMEKRRHDLSDGYAIIGPRSQVNLIENYSMDSVQLRNASGGAVVEIAGSTINVMTSGTVNIGSGDVVINSRTFLTHKHSGVQTGGGSTGGVV